MRITTIRSVQFVPPFKRRGAPVTSAPPPPPFVLSFPIRRPKRLQPEPEIEQFQTFRDALYAASIAFHGAQQFLSFTTIPSSESFPVPTFLGGLQGLQLFVAGALVNFSPAGAGSGASAAMISSQTIGRSTATFDIWVSDGSYAPYVGQTVLLKELGVTLFSGCIDTIAADRENGTLKGVTYHVTALDKSSICDRRVCKAATYTAGTDVATGVIAQIVASFLNGEGINTGGVPTDGSLGALTSDLVFNYDTVTDAFNQIGTLSGSVWWIDQYGTLFFSTEDNLPDAPFQLYETSGSTPGTVNVDSAGGGGGGGQLVVTTSLSGAGATSGYRNREYVVTNLNILPGSGSGGAGGGTGANTVETFDFANDQPGITSGYNPSNVRVPLFINTSLPIATVLSITVNGVDQTFYEITQQAGQEYMGTDDYVWYYASTTTIAGMGGSNQYATAQGVLAIPPGATVVITYVPGTNTSSSAAQVGTALVPIAPGGGTFGTCGSGIFEAVLQVKNISSQADLNAIAAAELAKSGGIPQILDCFTNKPGLFVGQVVKAYFPELGLPGTGTDPVKLLITKVVGTAIATDLGQGSHFTWAIEAVSNLDPGNWITYFTDLIAKSDNPLPVLQTETRTLILAPSGSLAGGVVSTNPCIVQNTGKVTEVYGAFTNPPLDQDAIVTIFDLTQGYALGSFRIPAGSLLTATTVIDPSLNIYVFAKDVLVAQIAYVNVGASPVAASQGTACMAAVH